MARAQINGYRGRIVDATKRAGVELNLAPIGALCYHRPWLPCVVVIGVTIWQLWLHAQRQTQYACRAHIHTGVSHWAKDKYRHDGTTTLVYTHTYVYRVTTPIRFSCMVRLEMYTYKSRCYVFRRVGGGGQEGSGARVSVFNSELGTRLT